MERFRERLGGHSIVGLDTSIFIYHLEAHPRYQPLTQALLVGVQAGQQEAITSMVTVMELTVHPWRVGRAAVPASMRRCLSTFQT
jgi:predicted nucleic acid-binding protein